MKQRFISSLEALSLFVVVNIVLVGGLFAYYLINANPREQFGIPGPLAHVIVAAYGPIVASSVVGYRNHLFGSVQVGDAPRRRLTPIRSGAPLLYGAVALGFAAAGATLVVISHGVKEELARWLIAGGATVWSGTIGFVFSRFLQAYVESEEKRHEAERRMQEPQAG
jgi:hypothetical protein